MITDSPTVSPPIDEIMNRLNLRTALSYYETMRDLYAAWVPTIENEDNRKQPAQELQYFQDKVRDIRPGVEAIESPLWRREPPLNGVSYPDQRHDPLEWIEIDPEPGHLCYPVARSACGHYVIYRHSRPDSRNVSEWSFQLNRPTPRGMTYSNAETVYLTSPLLVTGSQLTEAAKANNVVSPWRVQGIGGIYKPLWLDTQGEEYRIRSNRPLYWGPTLDKAKEHCLWLNSYQCLERERAAVHVAELAAEEYHEWRCRECKCGHGPVGLMIGWPDEKPIPPSWCVHEYAEVNYVLGKGRF